MSKALSLTQPYGTLMVRGPKTIETRSWYTSYRGRLYIHAAKGFPRWARDFSNEEMMAGRLPGLVHLGAIIGHVDLVDLKRTEAIADFLDRQELLYGDYHEGRWAWICENPVEFANPIPYRGMLGIFDLNLQEAAPNGD